MKRAAKEIILVVMIVGFCMVRKADACFAEELFLRQKIRMSAEQTASVREFAQEITVSYPYENLYDAKKVLLRFEQIQEFYEPTNEIFQEHRADGAVLQQQVEENNDAYWAQTKEDAPYQRADEEMVNQVCQMIADTINQMLEAGISIKEGETADTLSNLVILLEDGKSNAYITTTGKLILNPRRIQEKYLDKGLENGWKNTIMHETMHLIQRSSKTKAFAEGYTKNYGISYCWDDLSLNPLYFHWFFEASAEKMVCDLTDEEPLVYKTLLAYQNVIDYTLILNPNVQIESLERTTIEKNLNHFFALFDCRSEEEKQEVIKMMYALDVVLVNQPGGSSDLVDFLKETTESFGGKELNVLQRRCKASIFQTLSKQFYQNMAERLEEEPMQPEQIFCLITGFEGMINRWMLGDESTVSQNEMPFYDTYLKLQEHFFEQIIQTIPGGMAEKDVEKAYADYYERWNLNQVYRSIRDSYPG